MNPETIDKIHSYFRFEDDSEQEPPSLSEITEVMENEGCNFNAALNKINSEKTLANLKKGAFLNTYVDAVNDCIKYMDTLLKSDRWSSTLSNFEDK